MAAVLGRADHPAELRPLAVDWILNEGGDRIVNAHESLAAVDETEQGPLQFRIVEQHAQGVVEADRVEPGEGSRPEHLDVIAEHGLERASRLSHLLNRVVGDRNRGIGGSANGLAVAHREVRHEQPPGLPG